MALSTLLEDGVLRELDAAYYGIDWHFVAVDDLLSRLHSDLEQGMNMGKASELLEAFGPNILTSPQPCPAWLCCLLPWLKNTEAMQSFRACTPESANTIRDGRGICIDPVSLVPGDILVLDKGDMIPADCRVISCSETFTFTAFDQQEEVLWARADVGNPRESFLESRNMLYFGCTVLQGRCKCIAVAVGQGTVMSKLIGMRKWPFESFSGSSEKRLLSV